MSFLKKLETLNLVRQEELSPKPKSDLLHRVTEYVAESSELGSKVEEYYRQSQVDIKTRLDLEEIQDKVGDVLIALSFLCKKLNIDIEKATINKFNKTSDKYNLKTKWGAEKNSYEDYDKAILNLANKIRHWEMEAGECFKDYFMHGSVQWINWAFWLIAKGYTERGRAIIDSNEAGDTCICMHLLFDVTTSEIYPYTKSLKEVFEADPHDWDEEVNFKDYLLWSEFLLSCQTYKDRLEDFFADYKSYFDNYEE